MSYFSLVLACAELDEAVVELAREGIFSRQYGDDKDPQFVDIEILWDASNARKVFDLVSRMWSSLGPEPDQVKLWQDDEDLAFAEISGWNVLHPFVKSLK